MTDEIATAAAGVLNDGLVVVTGGAGFIGSNIVCDLAGAGCRVAVVDRLGQGAKWRHIGAAPLYDLVHPDLLFAWLDRQDEKIDAIVHMGAISSTTEADIDRIVATNIRLSLDLWRWCAAHNVRFIYASSAATYGDGGAGFADDEGPAALARLRPLNAYGWSKHVVDRRIADDVSRGRPIPPQWAALKFFNVYGPNEDEKGEMRSVIHKIYPLALAGESVTLFKSHRPDYSDGGQLRDFVYVKDCVAVVRWLLQHRETSGLFNVGTGIARSFYDMACAVFAAIGRAPRIRYVEMPAALRANYQYFTQAEMTRLRGAGFARPLFSLEDGVRDYVESELAQRG